MDRIQQTFARLSANQQKVLSPYITAGDPKPKLTVPLMHAMVKAGADILELGIPFSDPMAEGPVIQAAMERAVANQVTINDVLSMVQQFRTQDNTTPVILMGYLNPIEFMGYEAFAKQASAAGVDGTIIVDLPPEESAPLLRYWRQYQLHAIFLCSPTTSDTRMASIAKLASAYVYYVSLKGVTGSAALDIQDVQKTYAKRKTQLQLPILVGFGIKTPQVAAQITDFADGVVIGAGIVSLIAAHLANPDEMLQQVSQFVNGVRQAIDKV